MKRYLSFLLAAVTLIQLCAGCTGTPATPTETTSATQSTTQPTEALPAQPPELQLTEVMADNQKLCMGHTRDWVELYNAGADPVSLAGCYLTDDPETPQLLPLDGLQIDSGDYLAVVLDGAAPFHLSAVGGTVYLTWQGEILSQLTFGITEFGESFDQSGVCEYSTPGFANTEEGYLAYLQQQPLPELCITEVLPRNRNVPTGRDCYDFVELQNTSQQPLSLYGYALTDRWEQPSRFYLPDITLQPGEFYVVYCSGDSSLGENHAPFQVSSEGETLYLTKNSEYLDSLTVPGDLKKNESYGRSGKTPSYLIQATPGSENTDGYRHGIPLPQPDVAPGIYDQPVTVTLSGEGTIYYTLDGSRPTQKSKIYTQPLELKGVTTLRCFSVSGSRTSDLTAYTYAIGADIHELPVVTVSVPEDALTGSNGIFTKIFNRREAEGVVTYFEDGEPGFCLPFGFCLHGNDSRRGNKKNFQIRFRAQYGVTRVDYPLFENRDFTEFSSLVLKSGSEDWGRAMMRDELCTSLVDGTTSLHVLALKPVVLYINGKYWGIYYLRERFSADYVASHMGGSADAVDLLKGSSGTAQAGSAADYRALKNYVHKHDMSTEKNFQYLADRVDITSLMDWYICRSYLGDKDIGNIRRFRTMDGDGKWKWMFFDLDWSFWHTTDKPLTSIANRKGDAEHTLFRALLKSPQGREAFLRRYAYLMETVLNEDNINKAIDGFVAALEPEIARDRKRWNRSVSGWEKEVQKLRNYVNHGKRDRQVLKDLQQYFGLSDEKMREYFGEKADFL